jgi:tetratricopeptide (TPR) repeat protein
VAELAHHFIEAAQAGNVEKGVDYAVAAAEHATRRLAYEEAVAHYERAVQALEMMPAPDEERRCELLLALGEAHGHAGDQATARDAFTRAAELARGFADAERLARAALGYGGPWGIFGVVDETLIALLEESLAALGEGESSWRAMVLARLAAELYYSDRRERRVALSHAAVAMARRLGDPETLAYTLNARHGTLWESENVEDRLAVASEIVELAERAGNRELALHGHARRVADLLELGDIAGADAEIATHAALAAELRDVTQLWTAAVWRGTRALLDGRFDDAERFADAALAVAGRLREAEAAQCHTVQLFFCRLEQGRGLELEERFKHWRELPTVPGWHAALAFLYSEAGREREARSAFDPLAADGFRSLPRDHTWLPAIACAAETCALLGDRAAAPVLYELLLPYAGRNIVDGEGWSCGGSAARQLGMLASTMGHWAESEARFETALAFNAQMGARPLLARTQYQCAQMLLARDEPHDRSRALELLADALDTAQELGMKIVLERASALKLQAQGVPSPEHS